MESLKRNCSKLADSACEQTPQDLTKNEKLLKDFSSYTTLHGLHFLFDSQSKVRRLVWVVLLIGCAIVLVVQFQNSWGKYKQYLTITSKEIEKSDKLLFPAVSICNQNIMKRSKIEGTDAQGYLDQLDYWKHKAGIVANVSGEFDIEKAVNESGHKLEDMMKMCTWKGGLCGPHNFTVFFSFTRGLCYTFNSGKPGHPLLYATATGKMQALTLYLDAQPEEYYGPFSYDATGFKVLAHDQREAFPNMDDEAQDISPGFSTTMRIRKKKMISQKAPYVTACGERNLTYSKDYTSHACLLECYTKLTVKECGCRVCSMPAKGEHNETRLCSVEEISKCIFPVFGSHNPSRCDCPEPCEQVMYQAQLSLGYYPSLSVVELLRAVYANTVNWTITHEEIRKRIATVTVFYESLITDVARERPAYGLSDLGADIGGNMGLFLGCSLLTVCEFIDLIVVGILTCWRRGARRVHTIHVQSQ